MFINGASVSVDSFFVVAGLVTVYTFLRSMAKGVKFNIFMFYIHRYLRLTPVLAIHILIYTYIVQYLGNGPLWKIVDITLVEQCQKAWWSTLIYIINYVEEYSVKNLLFSVTKIIYSNFSVCLKRGTYLSICNYLFCLL